MAAEQSISDQHGVEAQPAKKRGARNRLPVFLERIEEWKPFNKICGNFHETLILPAAVARHCGKPRIDSPPRRHAFRDSVHHFSAAVHAIAARKIFWIA